MLTAERHLKSIELDMEELHDFVKRGVGRISKRDARMGSAQAGNGTEVAELASVPSPDYQHPDEASWTPQMREIQAKIMARRRMIG